MSRYKHKQTGEIVEADTFHVYEMDGEWKLVWYILNRQISNRVSPEQFHAQYEPVQPPQEAG